MRCEYLVNLGVSSWPLLCTNVAHGSKPFQFVRHLVLVTGILGAPSRLDQLRRYASVIRVAGEGVRLRTGGDYGKRSSPVDFWIWAR